MKKYEVYRKVRLVPIHMQQAWGSIPHHFVSIFMSRSMWKGPYIDFRLKKSIDKFETPLSKNVSVLEESSNIETSSGEQGVGLDVYRDLYVSTSSVKESSSEEKASPVAVRPTKNKAKLGKGKKKNQVVSSKKKGTGRKKKGMSKDEKLAIKTLKLKMRLEGSKEKTFGNGPIRTASRSSCISPDFVGSTRMVHNGKNFDRLVVVESMIGHAIGEFSPTRRSRHNLSGRKKKLSIRRKDFNLSGNRSRISLSRNSNWSI